MKIRWESYYASASTWNNHAANLSSASSWPQWDYQARGLTAVLALVG